MNSRKVLAPFLAAAFAISLMAQPLLANTFGLFTYTDDGTSLTITDYPEDASGAVTIPATIFNKPVRAIGNQAFLGCGSLTSVTIPSTVTSIGNHAFYKCFSLTHATLPSSITSIGEYAFCFCRSLTSVEIPSGAASIGDSAFAYCSSLTGVVIPSSVTHIGVGPFYECSSLLAILVNAANPNYSSGNGVLFNKLQTSLIQYPAGANGNYSISTKITNIEPFAFCGCRNLTSVTIPSSITSIGRGAFNGCGTLTSVTIPTSVTSIADQMFEDCLGLTSMTLPSSIASIGNLAFHNCSSLSSVTIPSSVTTIGSAAFRHCRSLTGVTIPSSVTSIGDGVFAGCTGLLAISVSAANPNYSSRDGVLFNILQTTLIQYPSGASGNYTIPSSVTSIAGSRSGFCTDTGGGAFSYCDGLTSITIPSTSVTSIGDYAFYNSSSLASAVFQGNAPSMGASVFDGTAAAFKVNYYKSRTGFTSPTWYGYPSVALAGAPEIVVEYPAGSSLVDGTAKKSFGTVKVGKISTAKTFTIKNTGTANLTGLAITKNGAHSSNFIVTAPAKTTLAPGASTTFTVRFKPTATGTRNAAIHIKNNDANENPFDIKLTGLGAVP